MTSRLHRQGLQGWFRGPGIFFLTAALLGFSGPARAFQDKAPAFQEQDLNGKRHSLDAYQGKVVVLYFWATWCGYCRKDVPNMIRVFREFESRNVVFLSVSLDEDVERLRQFIAEKEIPYPVIFRGEGWNNQLAQLYGISGVPTYVLIDSEGYYAGSDAGAESLRAVLPAYLK